MMRHTFFTFLFFLLAATVAAQGPHHILRSFSAVKQPNGVNLKWVIKGGQQCQGTRVYRADESLVFEQINHVEGICGSFTEDETYTYFDNSPKPNAYNYYRLEMGFQGVTDTVVVFFEDFGSDNHLLISSSELNEYTILFSNDLNREATLHVYDVSGKLMHQDSEIGNDFVIEPTGWRAGIYVFRISGVAETDITGKLYFAGQ
jgi:hypothetical protein